MDFETVETAIADWVQAVTGLASAQVYFTTQNYRADERQLRVAITLGEFPLLGQSERRQSFDDTRPRGEELNVERLTMGELTVTFQAYGPKSGVVGNTGPRKLLSRLRASLELETYRAPLRAAGLGPSRRGPVGWLPAISGTDFEARAVFEVVFSGSESAEEKVGYIQTAKVHVALDGTPTTEATIQLSPDVVGYLGGAPDGTQDDVVMPAPTSSMEGEVLLAMYIDKGIITPPVAHDDPQLFSFSRQELIDDSAYLWATALEASAGVHTVEWVDTNDQVQKSTPVLAAGGVVVDSIDYATIETATPFGSNLGTWRVDVYAPGGGPPYFSQPFELTA